MKAPSELEARRDDSRDPSNSHRPSPDPFSTGPASESHPEIWSFQNDYLSLFLPARVGEGKEEGISSARSSPLLLRCPPRAPPEIVPSHSPTIVTRQTLEQPVQSFSVVVLQSSDKKRRRKESEEENVVSSTSLLAPPFSHPDSPSTRSPDSNAHPSQATTTPTPSLSCSPRYPLLRQTQKRRDRAKEPNVRRERGSERGR